MKTLLKITIITMLLGISSQAAFANALQEKIQARKDITSYGKKFRCTDFVVAANKGDLVLIDAFLKAGISKTCQFTRTGNYLMTEPWRARPWSNNALSAAIVAGQLEVSQLLLDYGVPFEQDRKFWSYEANGPSETNEVLLFYPRPTLINLLYTYETKKEIKTERRLKALKWAVEHGADLNATEMLGSSFSYADGAHIFM